MTPTLTGAGVGRGRRSLLPPAAAALCLMPRFSVKGDRAVKLTPRQADVMANLSRVTTDGSRHEPQFRLAERNVSVQVRSLLRSAVVELRNGRLVEAAPAPAKPRPATVDTAAAVTAMRDLLGGEADA